ncbi:hypothetical protein ACYATO_00050 [Lactobacillaceae bacterium Melli_B3]
MAASDAQSRAASYDADQSRVRASNASSATDQHSSAVASNSSEVSADSKATSQAVSDATRLPQLQVLLLMTLLLKHLHILRILQFLALTMLLSQHQQLLLKPLLMLLMLKQL